MSPELCKATRLHDSWRSGEREVPGDACTLGGGQVEFQSKGVAVFQSSGDGPVSIPITMLARSAQPIEHWFWGRVVHDMAGMKLHKAKLPIDYLHDEPIGYLDQFKATAAGLVVSGALVATRAADDTVNRLLDLARGGVPWEASINFGGDGLRYEFVDEGQTTKVNGFVFAGPGVVIREWPLRGVAVCPYGADMQTESRFSKPERFAAKPVAPASKSKQVIRFASGFDAFAGRTAPAAEQPRQRGKGIRIAQGCCRPFATHEQRPGGPDRPTAA